MANDIGGSGGERLDHRLIQIFIQHHHDGRVVFGAALSQELTRGDAVHHHRPLSKQDHPQLVILDQHLDGVEVGRQQDRLEVRGLEISQPAQIVLGFGNDDDSAEHGLRLTRDDVRGDLLLRSFRGLRRPVHHDGHVRLLRRLDRNLKSQISNLKLSFVPSKSRARRAENDSR